MHMCFYTSVDSPAESGNKNGQTREKDCYLYSTDTVIYVVFSHAKDSRRVVCCFTSSTVNVQWSCKTTRVCVHLRVCILCIFEL